MKGINVFEVYGILRMVYIFQFCGIYGEYFEFIGVDVGVYDISNCWCLGLFEV